MISLLHGIIDSKPFVAIYGCTDPSALNYNPSANIDNGSCEYPGVFTLTLNRTTIPIFGPFGGAEPITPGTAIGYYTENNPGIVHFEISVSGDTSSIAEYGIVSATFASPTYSSNPQVINSYIDFQNPTNGFTYSVSSPELRYYRAYALINTGDYSYSIGPGVLFQMEEIDLSLTSVFTEFIPPYYYYDVTVNAKLVNPVGTVSEAGFYINQAGLSVEPEKYDPYWWGATGTNITTATQAIINNELSFTFNTVGGYSDISFYCRSFAVYNGQRYWSQLHFILI